MAQIFHVDGRVTELPPPTGGGYTLDEVKVALGCDASCFIEELPIGEDESLLIDESGKIRHLALNLGATVFAITHGALSANDYIVGNALYVRNRDGCWT